MQSFAGAFYKDGAERRSWSELGCGVAGSGVHLVTLHWRWFCPPGTSGNIRDMLGRHSWVGELGTHHAQNGPPAGSSGRKPCPGLMRTVCQGAGIEAVATLGLLLSSVWGLQVTSLFWALAPSELSWRCSRESICRDGTAGRWPWWAPLGTQHRHLGQVLAPLVKQDSGRASMGMKGAPGGRDGCQADGVLSLVSFLFFISNSLSVKLRDRVLPNVRSFMMCDCRAPRDWKNVRKRGRSRGFWRQLWALLGQSHSQWWVCLALSSSFLLPILCSHSFFPGSPRGLQGSTRTGRGWRGGRSPDWRAVTVVCKQPCSLGSSAPFLSRRSGPTLPASCLEMLTK